MPFVVGIKRLSQLSIDANKDWLGYLLRNLGAPAASGDAFRLGDVISDGMHGSRGSALHTDSHARSHDHSLAADGSPIAASGVPGLDASKITTGRFGMPRMPDGTSGYFLKGQGAGADPVYDAPPVGGEVKAGDLLQAEANTEHYTSSVTYVKVKEVKLQMQGALRVKFDLLGGNPGYPVYACVYKNDVAIGTERSREAQSYATFSEDISGWVAGDLCQLYYRGSSVGGWTAWVRNFKVGIDSPRGAVVTLD